MLTSDIHRGAAAPSRRPISARGSGWARVLSGAALRAGVSPNQISVASVGFAAAGAGLMLAPGGRWHWLAAACCVPARLVCNLLDGMVAIEGGRATPEGVLYNEVPDRMADTLFLVALGYAAGLPGLGWGAACAAMATAYIRVLGGAAGLKQDFSGMMAKQQRMAVLGVALAAQGLGAGPGLLGGAAWVITAGALVTCATRVRNITQALRLRGAP